MNDQLARIRYVTANFDMLQGLRSLPLGILFLLYTGGIAGWIPLFDPRNGSMLDAVVIALGFGLYWWIGEYYKRRFGQVERDGSRSWKCVLSVVTMLIAIYIDGTGLLPVSTLSLCMGAWFLWLYVDWKARIHYLVIGFAIAVMGLLPLISSAGMDPRRLQESGGALFYAALGLGVIIGGLLDHRLLAKTLPPAPQENSNELNLSTES